MAAGRGFNQAEAAKVLRWCVFSASLCLCLATCFSRAAPGYEDDEVGGEHTVGAARLQPPHYRCVLAGETLHLCDFLFVAPSAGMPGTSHQEISWCRGRSGGRSCFGGPAKASHWCVTYNHLYFPTFSLPPRKPSSKATSGRQSPVLKASRWPQSCFALVRRRHIELPRTSWTV